MTKTQKISAAILAYINAGLSTRDAFDRVLGEGAYEKMASDLYDKLQASANG